LTSPRPARGWRIPPSTHPFMQHPPGEPKAGRTHPCTHWRAEGCTHSSMHPLTSRRSHAAIYAPTGEPKAARTHPRTHWRAEGRMHAPMHPSTGGAEGRTHPPTHCCSWCGQSCLSAEQSGLGNTMHHWPPAAAHPTGPSQICRTRAVVGAEAEVAGQRRGFLGCRSRCRLWRHQCKLLVPLNEGANAPSQVRPR
jgi:hypothetical protein